MSGIRRAIIIEPSLASEQGHYLSYAASLRDAWVARGMETIILGHRAVAGTSLAEVVTPVFAGPAWDARLGRLVSFRRSLAARLRRVLRLPTEGRSESRARFRRDLEAGLSRLPRPLGSGDLVLFATCGEIECLALADLLRRRPAARQARWALVFRRPLVERRRDSRLSGPASPESSSIVEAIRRVREAPGYVTCFTDTLQLRRQYEAAMSAPFHPLPIPHALQSRNSASGGSEIVVSYLGDARLEKGFTLLPGIVEAVRAARFDRSVKLRIQCNFNVPGGEAGCRETIEQLRAMAGPDLELLDQALNQADYAAALASTGLMLCPYDGGAYRERSSGIACEALAMGIPVLVPSGTWLEGEFALEADAWLRGAARSADLHLAGSTLGSAARRGEVKRDLFVLSAEGDIAASPGVWASLDVSIPPAAGERRLSVAFGVDDCPAETILSAVAEARTSDGRLSTRRVYTLHVGEGAAYTRAGRRTRPLFSLRAPADIAHIRLLVRIDGVERDVVLRALSLRLEAVAAAAPLSAIGYAFGDDAEAPAAVAEMLAHFDHYRRTARAFAPAYTAFHNAAAVALKLETAAIERA